MSTEDMDGGDVSRSPGMMDSSANAEVSKSSHLLPPQLPTTVRMWLILLLVCYRYSTTDPFISCCYKMIVVPFIV